MLSVGLGGFWSYLTCKIEIYPIKLAPTSNLGYQLSTEFMSLPTAAYIHIPFCRRRCYYCDFPISVVGDRKTGANSGTMQIYLDFLAREIAEQLNYGKPLATIFFGGGTPSLLTVAQVERILELLAAKFGIERNAEISIEIDPGTFELEQLRGYLAAGVNRVSMGVQAFQDRLLAVCGRSHTVADIYQAVETIHRADVTNWSLDLISGLPQQTWADWEMSLRSAMQLWPDHISCYDLIIEPQTPFAKQYQPGDAPLPSDETAAEMYRTTQQLLTVGGYEHYEISNYAQPGYRCRHNLTYWRNLPYYSFGMGAASYLEGYRFTRPRTTQAYYQWVKAGSDWRLELTSQGDRFLETLMLGFRLQDGVSLKAIAEEFGDRILIPLWNCLERYHQAGWVEVLDRLGTILSTVANLNPEYSLRLSDPEGLLFSNTILAEIFNTSFENYPKIHS
jgi:putative oxygen-independent coproporphyrinogen III oxidase